MHAVEAIAAGEVVAVKGGHIVNGSVAAGLPEAIRNSGFQIGPDQFLAALDPEEYDGVMMRVNHSCDPNVGMGGNVLLVSMRDIAAGEELTIDYALFLADPGLAMHCRCGATTCRGVLTGTDWLRAELQQRYQGGSPGGSSRKSPATRRPSDSRSGPRADRHAACPANPGEDEDAEEMPLDPRVINRGSDMCWPKMRKQRARAVSPSPRPVSLRGRSAPAAMHGARQPSARYSQERPRSTTGCPCKHRSRRAPAGLRAGWRCIASIWQWQPADLRCLPHSLNFDRPSPGSPLRSQ